MEVDHKCKMSAQYLQNYARPKNRDMGCEYYYIVTKLINDGEEKIVHVCNVGLRKNGPPCREVLEARTAFCHPSLKLTELAITGSSSNFRIHYK